MRNDLLYRFHVSIGSFPGSITYKLGKFGPFKELRRRAFPHELVHKTSTSPWFEWFRLVIIKMGFQSMVQGDKNTFSVFSGYKYLDRKVASRLSISSKEGSKAIYAYEDGALESFRKAEQFAMLKMYDLPIGYWRAARELLANTQNEWPGWAMTINGFADSKEKICRKEEELALADHIFVASSFTARTLKRYPGELKNIRVIPYGFPPPQTGRTYENTEGRPIKLLFVGGLSQRKGLAELFHAVERLGDKVTLTIVGRKSVEGCKALDKALAKYHYIPSLPHSEVLSLMREHDVFVFPSLFEGFGLVITEAMSQGTPVITTERTAGPDIITDGEDGWIVTAGSVDDLHKRLQYLVEHPAEIERVGRQALETAAKRPWSRYGDELSEAVKEIIS